MHDRRHRTPARPGRTRALLLALALLSLAGPALAVRLEVTSAEVEKAGDAARICVRLHTEGETVAGTQNDLTWDGSCATLADKDRCEANPVHGKALNAALPPATENTLRAFVLSLTDVNPIEDTELYCCEFQSNLSEQGKCCNVDISRVGASTPDGVALDTQGTGGRICLGVAAAAAAPAEAAPPAPAAGMNPWVIGLVLLAVIGILLIVFLRRKS